LEEGFNNFEDVRQERVSHDPRTRRGVSRQLQIAKPTVNPFGGVCGQAGAAIAGDRTLVDLNDETVKNFQNKRLEERAAPKTIDEEVGFC